MKTDKRRISSTAIRPKVVVMKGERCRLIAGEQNMSKTQAKKSARKKANRAENFDDFLVIKLDDKDRLLRLGITQDPEVTKQRLTSRVDKTIRTLNVDHDQSIDEQLEKANSSFANFLHQYSETIKGFYHLIGITSMIRIDLRESYIDNRLLGFADKHLTSLEKKGDIRVYGIPPTKSSEIRKRSREVGEFLEGMRQLPSLLLMGLVARFDAQISSFVRLLLKDRPEAIGSRQSEFDLATVLNFGDIEDLKDFFVDQEVYRLMHASHHDQIQFIEQTFHISIQDKLKDYPNFLEVFERRNLVAHGEGVANSRYDSRCQLYKVKPEDRLEEGSFINVPPKYLFAATDIIYKVGFILIFSLWMKRHKDEVELAYGMVLETTFDLMLENRFSLVSSILDFILTYPIKHADDLHLRMLAVNKSICDKRLETKDWRSSIEKFKWGASAPTFQICIAAIDEDLETVCGLMEQVSASNIPSEIRIGSTEFRSWPAFHWVRERKEFRDRFRELFNESIEPDDPNMLEKIEEAEAEKSRQPDTKH